MILGNAAATKILVEIASQQPVAVTGLPERRLVSEANLGYSIRRLTALGLVRRFRRAEHRDRYVLALDDRHPLAPLIRELCQSIAEANGLNWAPSPSPATSLAVTEGPNVTQIRLFGHRAGELGAILGHPNRTVAICTVSTVGQADASTIARIARVTTDGDMHRLLDPIEADGVFESGMIGSIRLYQIPPHARWTGPLANLCQGLLAERSDLESRIATAPVLIRQGGFSNRKHLRKYLERKDATRRDG